jgi:hypothetical protein
MRRRRRERRGSKDGRRQRAQDAEATRLGGAISRSPFGGPIAPRTLPRRTSATQRSSARSTQGAGAVALARPVGRDQTPRGVEQQDGSRHAIEERRHLVASRFGRGELLHEAHRPPGMRRVSKAGLWPDDTRRTLATVVSWSRR